MNFRRFTRLRLRLLLLKQDEISQLEHELDAVDEAETKEIFLGCRRRDESEARKETLKHITRCLAEYDTLLVQCSTAISKPSSRHRDIADLRNWVNGTRSIARQETAYLDQEEDLMNLTSIDEGVIYRVERLIDDIVFYLEAGLHRIGWRRSSKSFRVIDANMQLFVAGQYLRRTSRLLTTWIATVIVLAPVVVLNYILNSTLRLILIVISGSLFLCCVSWVTNARTVELFVAGASYTAVLVVFTSSGQQQMLNNTS